MSKLDTESQRELNGVHPKLVLVVEDSAAMTKQVFAVHDGIRTLQEQHALLSAGASTTLKSLHLEQPDGYGHAVDLVPIINDRLRWEWEPIFKIAHAVAKAAKKHNVYIIWGGVWDKPLNELDTTSPESLKREMELYAARRKAQGKRVFLDGPHFQLAK